MPTTEGEWEHRLVKITKVSAWGPLTSLTTIVLPSSVHQQEHFAPVDHGVLHFSFESKQVSTAHVCAVYTTSVPPTIAQCRVVVVAVSVDMQDGEGEGEGGEGDEQGVRKKRRKRRRDKQFALDEEDYDLLEEAVRALLLFSGL